MSEVNSARDLTVAATLTRPAVEVDVVNGRG